MPPKFLDQYMYKFSFEKPKKKKKFTTCQHHKRWTKIFHLSVCYQKRFAKNLFATNFAPPKVVAPQGHGLIGLRHKVALATCKLAKEGERFWTYIRLRDFIAIETNIRHKKIRCTSLFYVSTTIQQLFQQKLMRLLHKTEP